tara:strand:- start:104 stop:652 length:549 start_codon:yes stop_codon:yes gene_type:complete
MSRELTLVKKITSSERYGELNTIENNILKGNIKTLLGRLENVFKTNKIKFIVGNFSGGHDQGGFDDVMFADENMDEIIIPSKDQDDFRVYSDKSEVITYEKENSKDILIFKATSYERFDLNDRNILETILFDSGCLEEYGSFAGEFSVDGTVKLDVFTGIWTMEGQESLEQFESFERMGDLA